MEKKIQEALYHLKKPGVIATPTETVWGLSCSALSEAQIERIYTIKNRPSNKSFIVLVDSIEMLEHYVGVINKKQREWLLSDRPTTVIFSNIKGLPPSLLADDYSLAFRITRHPQIKTLITQFGAPIVSTSANISGSPAAQTYEELSPAILEAIDYALNLQSDYTPTSTPSRIVKLNGDEVEIIRP